MPIKRFVRKRTARKPVDGSATTNRVQSGLDGERPLGGASAPVTFACASAQPYVLDVPSGTLVYSAIVAHHRLWGHTRRSKTLELITGDSVGEAHLPFENRAAIISRTLLLDCDGGRSTLLRHTPLGYFARGMHEEVEQEILDVLLKGQGSVAARYFKTPRKGALTSRTLVQGLCGHRLLRERLRAHP